MAKKSDITGKNAKAEEIALTEFVAQATNLLKKSKTQSEIQTMKNIDFGNGRYVRTIVERAAMAQASRLLNERDGEISNADIRLLCEEDFTAAIHREKEDQRRKSPPSGNGWNRARKRRPKDADGIRGVVSV